MSTCEELYADILVMNAAIIVDDANITAANASKMAHASQKMYDQMNYIMQGCGTPPMARADDDARQAGKDELWEKIEAEMRKQCDEWNDLVDKSSAAVDEAVAFYEECLANRAALKPE